MPLIILGAVAIVAVVLAGSAAATARFRARYAREKGDLFRRARESPPVAQDPGAAARLPAPVRRYLEVTGALDAPPLRVATLRQKGGLRMAPDAPWMSFEAEEAFAMEPPGFVWLARARMAPLLHLVARDRYVDGQGAMLVRLLGAFTVADASGPEIDRGAALRYWGEVLAFPERVLDPHLSWDPLDERRARVTVRQGALEVAAVAEFDDAGLLTAIHAERFREVRGKAVLTPWSGHFREWKALGGRRLPTRWEAVWHLPEGDFPAVWMEILALETA